MICDMRLKLRQRAAREIDPTIRSVLVWDMERKRERYRETKMERKEELERYRETKRERESKRQREGGRERKKEAERGRGNANLRCRDRC